MGQIVIFAKIVFLILFAGISTAFALLAYFVYDVFWDGGIFCKIIAVSLWLLIFGMMLLILYAAYSDGLLPFLPVPRLGGFGGRR